MSRLQNNSMRYINNWQIKDYIPSTIAEVIKEILSLSDEELYQKGKNGRKLIEEKYEQHKVACMMKQLYEWIESQRILLVKSAITM